jgi:hypothetical protein
MFDFAMISLFSPGMCAYRKNITLVGPLGVASVLVLDRWGVPVLGGAP